jgi:hypothetical protein
MKECHTRRLFWFFPEPFHIRIRVFVCPELLSRSYERKEGISLRSRAQAGGPQLAQIIA